MDPFKVYSEGNLGFRKRVRCTNEQQHRLVEMVEQDHRLHTDNFLGPDSQRTMRKRWEEVAFILNGMGPAKDGTGWKDTWRDLKIRVRQKYRKGLTETCESKRLALTQVEERVLQIIGSRTPLPSHVPSTQETSYENHEFDQSSINCDSDNIFIQPVSPSGLLGNQDSGENSPQQYNNDHSEEPIRRRRRVIKTSSLGKRRRRNMMSSRKVMVRTSPDYSEMIKKETQAHMAVAEAIATGTQKMAEAIETVSKNTLDAARLIAAGLESLAAAIRDKK